MFELIRLRFWISALERKQQGYEPGAIERLDLSVRPRFVEGPKKPPKRRLEIATMRGFGVPDVGAEGLCGRGKVRPTLKIEGAIVLRQSSLQLLGLATIGVKVLVQSPYRSHERRFNDCRVADKRCDRQNLEIIKRAVIVCG